MDAKREKRRVTCAALAHCRTSTFGCLNSCLSSHLTSWVAPPQKPCAHPSHRCGGAGNCVNHRQRTNKNKNNKNKKKQERDGRKLSHIHAPEQHQLKLPVLWNGGTNDHCATQPNAAAPDAAGVNERQRRRGREDSGAKRSRDEDRSRDHPKQHVPGLPGMCLAEKHAHLRCKSMLRSPQLLQGAVAPQPLCGCSSPFFANAVVAEATAPPQQAQEGREEQSNSGAIFKSAARWRQCCSQPHASKCAAQCQNYTVRIPASTFPEPHQSQDPPPSCTLFQIDAALTQGTAVCRCSSAPLQSLLRPLPQCCCF